MSMLDRQTIVTAARRWIGTPYEHQASLISVGCDCLGLLRGVWRETIGPEPEALPSYYPDWGEADREERLQTALRKYMREAPVTHFSEGDALLFRFRDNWPMKHVGIATSMTHMLHAHAGACVAEVAIGHHWRRRLVAAFSFPGVEMSV